MGQIQDIICLCTVGYLAICATLPFCVWLYYRKSLRDIGRSVGWMAFGEFSGMLGTFLFAVFEFGDLFDHIDWRWSTILRIVMGTIAMVTTIHLARSTYYAIIDFENEQGEK